MITRYVLLLLVCIFLAACNLPQVEAGTTQAWIDAPLDGSTLPLAPYEIIFHASAATGNPTAVELTINGKSVTLDSAKLDQPLVTVRYQWNPGGPGRYTITARTRDSRGNWSSPHTHVVSIGTPPITVTSTYTATVSPTPAKTGTPSPTPTKTATVTPIPAAQAGVTFLSASTDQFYVGDQSCGPTEVTLEAQVSNLQQVPHMVLFYKLRDKDTGKYTDWNSVDMRLAGNGKFTFTLKGSSIPGLSGRENWLIYQFIGTGADNQPMARTQVYSDITFSVCGRFIIPPPG